MNIAAQLAELPGHEIGKVAARRLLTEIEHAVLRHLSGADAPADDEHWKAAMNFDVLRGAQLAVRRRSPSFRATSPVVSSDVRPGIGRLWSPGVILGALQDVSSQNGGTLYLESAAVVGNIHGSNAVLSNFDALGVSRRTLDDPLLLGNVAISEIFQQTKEADVTHLHTATILEPAQVFLASQQR